MATVKSLVTRSSTPLYSADDLTVGVARDAYDITDGVGGACARASRCAVFPPFSFCSRRATAPPLELRNKGNGGGQLLS